MANFVALVDPERDRREHFVRSVEPLLGVVEGLGTGRCGAGDFAAVWTASPRASVSHVTDASGAAVIWGDAIPGPVPGGSMRRACARCGPTAVRLRRPTASTLQWLTA